MTDQITLTEIARMDTVIPDLRKLHLSLEAVEMYICNFACITAEALRMYDESIDAEQPYPVRNDLYKHYEFALDALNGWKKRRDELKAEILAGLS